MNRKREKPKAINHRAAPPSREPHRVRRRRLSALVAAVLLVSILGALGWALARDGRPDVYGFEVVNTYPHDQNAFCQGLVIADGVLYEGTGKYGESTLRKVDLTTGRVLDQTRLENQLFGEGITVWDDRIFQITWRSGVGIVYEKNSLRELERFRIRSEGWGLTNDGKNLILSDGTSVLQFLDPQTYRVIRRLTVRDRGIPIRNLNELEYVGGEIMANVWMTDKIVRISPETGSVTGWIDLRGLAPPQTRRDREAVLNGIAYDAKAGRLFVTGKNWPTLFEIRLRRSQNAR